MIGLELKAVILTISHFLPGNYDEDVVITTNYLIDYE